MANPAATNLKSLPAFHRLNAPDVLAVQLKANGGSYARISAEMEATYGFKRSTEAIRDWFRPNGRLTVAVDQYREFMASESLKETQLLAMRATLPAVVVLVKLLNHENPRVRLNAAKVILSMTMPDAKSPSRHGKRVRAAEEPGIPQEFLTAVETLRTEEDHQTPKEQQNEDDGWIAFMDAVRLESARAAHRETHRLSPKSPLFSEADSLLVAK